MGFWNKSTNNAEASNEAFENFFDIETLNRTSCNLINSALYKTPNKASLQPYYYSCLDTMFRKLDLYRTKKQKSYDWQCSKYPDYSIVHGVLTNKNRIVDPQTGKELSQEERIVSMLECQSCQTCPKKKLRKDLVEDKLKPALYGSFAATFPKAWLDEMDRNASQDLSQLPKQKKEKVVDESYCQTMRPEQLDFVPHTPSNRGELYVPTREVFEKEKQVVKYQYCVSSMLCSQSIKKCMDALKSRSEDGATSSNKHLSTCLNFDQETLKCMSKI